MRKIIILFSSLLFIVGMAACSQSNDEGDKGVDENVEQETTEDDRESDEAKDDSDNQSESNDASVEEAKNQDDMEKMMEELDFYEIKVEISYGKDKEYEAEIEHHDNGDIEAKVEDEINGENIYDDLEAFNSIYPKAKKLNISKDTDKKDAIDQVLEAFELESDYKEFDVEFTFDDDTKLSFED